jgi:hypothetical protein
LPRAGIEVGLFRARAVVNHILSGLRGAGRREKDSDYQKDYSDGENCLVLPSVNSHGYTSRMDLVVDRVRIMVS